MQFCGEIQKLPTTIREGRMRVMSAKVTNEVLFCHRIWMCSFLSVGNRAEDLVSLIGDCWSVHG